MSIWVDTVRKLTLGDLYSPATSPLFADREAARRAHRLSVGWFVFFLVVFSFLGVRFYRKT